MRADPVRTTNGPRERADGKGPRFLCAAGHEYRWWDVVNVIEGAAQCPKCEKEKADEAT